MDDSRHDVQAYVSFPDQHRAKPHSTNPLERLNKEVEHRADVVGIFPSEQLIIRPISAMPLEQNDVHGPPLPCTGFRLMTTDPVLAVVYLASSRGNTPQ